MQQLSATLLLFSKAVHVHFSYVAFIRCVRRLIKMSNFSAQVANVFSAVSGLAHANTFRVWWCCEILKKVPEWGPAARQLICVASGLQLISVSFVSFFAVARLHFTISLLQSVPSQSIDRLQITISICSH